MADIADLFTEPTAQERTAQILRDSLEGGRNVIRASLENVERMIWANPFGLSPQEVFDILGTRAGPLLALKATLLPILVASFPGQAIGRLKPDNVTLVVGEDGTVTIMGA